MTDHIAELDTLLDQLTGTPPTEPAAPLPVFPNVGAYVDQYLSQVIERRLATGAASGALWCRQWWAHPEALSRIYALWRAWETLRISDPATGMSIWWRDHLDPHLNALTNETGPFTRCRPDKHTPPATLPVDPVPAGILAQLPDSQ